jgi:hypothetical protein
MTMLNQRIRGLGFIVHHCGARSRFRAGELATGAGQKTKVAKS